MKGKLTTLLTICPVRSKPDDTSELVNQILFGEEVIVLDKGKNDWLKIRSEYDGYVGWVDQKQFVPSDSGRQKVFYCADLFESVFGDEKSTWITLGAELPDFDGMTSTLGGYKFRFSGQAIIPGQINGDLKEGIERIARKLLNAPYLWGGRSPAGIDCSGFTQIVFKCIGIPLLRDAKDQATQGEIVDFASSAISGDLAFFTKHTEKISHVGIVLPNNKIIHASGHVRIDTYDHYGIFNNEIQQYTHRLKIIKRYLPA